MIDYADIDYADINPQTLLKSFTFSRRDSQPTICYTRTERERIREKFISELPGRVRIHMNQTYGKDNLSQCFKSEGNFRLIALPVFNSGFASVGDWITLTKVSRVA